MGVFGFTPARSKNLTVGKIYFGWLVPISESDRASHFARSDYKFLAFNDVQQWDCYELNLFGPVAPPSFPPYSSAPDTP